MPRISKLIFGLTHPQYPEPSVPYGLCLIYSLLYMITDIESAVRIEAIAFTTGY